MRTILLSIAFFLSCTAFLAIPLAAQSVSPNNPSPLLPEGVAGVGMEDRTVIDERVRRFVLPQKVLWKTEQGIVDEQKILEPVSGQTSTASMGSGFLMEYKEQPGGILLDMGVQIHGGIRLETRNLADAKVGVGKTVRVRVRFGESADEAMSEIGEKGSMNDHSVRDMVVTVPWLGAIEFGETAFRFVRLDLVDKGTNVRFDSVRGGMIDRGATTFWEDFDLDWLDGSGRIDTITPEGVKSLHGDYGAHCYIGFRHSLCHGWASGPAPWLSRYVLGVTPIEPGFKKTTVKPFLGDLDWAEGTFPTPHGVIRVRHEKQSDGSIKTTVDAPKGVEIVQ